MYFRNVGCIRDKRQSSGNLDEHDHLRAPFVTWNNSGSHLQSVRAVNRETTLSFSALHVHLYEGARLNLGPHDVRRCKE